MVYAVALCALLGAGMECQVVSFHDAGLVPNRSECMQLAHNGNIGRTVPPPPGQSAFVCMQNDTNGWLKGHGWRPVEPQ
jgi:hypothetical protein